MPKGDRPGREAKKPKKDKTKLAPLGTAAPSVARAPNVPVPAGKKK